MFDDAPLQASVVPRASTRASECRRKRKVDLRSLPKCFLVYNMKTQCIIAAVQIITCFAAAHLRKDVWVAGRVAMLSTPWVVSTSDRKYNSNVFELLPRIESEVRLQNCTVGGALNHHFIEHAACSWKVIQCSDDMCLKLTSFDGNPVEFDMCPSTSRSVGIIPSPWDARVEPVLALEAEAAFGAQVVAEVDTGDAQPAKGSSTAATASDNMQNLSNASSSGTVACRFAPEAILGCLQLAQHLKPGATLDNTLSRAAAIFFGAGDAFAGALANGTYLLPSIGLLRMARVRLDIMSILFEQKRWLTWKCVRYIMVDASPQLGFNYFCMREDRIAIPRSQCLTPEFRAKYDINGSFESRICVISTLGLGNAGLVKKGQNTSNTYLMESSSKEEFDGKRCEVRGSCSDSGTEKGIGDDTVMILPQFIGAYAATDKMAYMYPRNLHIPGHLHIIFNSLEAGAKGMDLAAKFFECLTVLQHFLSNKQLRRKFQDSCLSHLLHIAVLFDSYATCHIDWRWEFLSLALDRLIPLYPFLALYFDANKMKQGETSVLNMTIIASMVHVLATEGIEVFGEMLRVVGKALEKIAHKLESCWCHGSLWMSKVSFKRKTAELLASTNRSKCVWKGRLASWFVAVGMSEFFRDLQECMSDRLHELLGALAPTKRGQLLVAMSLLRSRIIEELREKWFFWHHVPYRAVGICWCCCGGTVERSKEILKECCEEFDKAVREGRGGKLHRVAHLIFAKATVCRRELDAFYSGDLPLENYYVAFTTLQEYSLVSLVERSIEEVHARIKRAGAACSHSLPPFICSKLREGANLSELDKNRAFYDLVVARWRSHTFLDDVLAQRVPKAELKTMTNLSKIKRIYQCGMTDEYLSTMVPRGAQQQWLALTSDSRQDATKLPESFKLCISYWKDTLAVGCFYSLPAAVCDRATKQDGSCYDTSSDPVASGFASLDNRTVSFDTSSLGDIRIFQVLNTRPENRQNVAMHHVQSSRTLVNIAFFDVVTSRSPSQVVVHRGTDTHKPLDVCVLAERMGESLSCFFRWRLLDQRALATVRQPTLALADLDTYQLPLQVGMAPAASSSAALVIADRSSDASFEAETSLAFQHIVDNTHNSSADVNGVRLYDDAHGLHADVAMKLQASGAIVVQEDEFGDAHLVANMSALKWDALLKLGEPSQHARLPWQNDPLAAPKLQAMFELHQLGWRTSNELPAAFVQGKPRALASGWHHPKSYFVALIHIDDIFKKGVKEILHGNKDVYYRCLLRLPAEPLLKMLLAMAGKSDAWFRGQLKENKCVATLEDEEGNGLAQDPEGAPPLALADVPPELGDHGIVIPSVVGAEWTRVVVDLGDGTPSLKVYFDHYSKSAVRQRGWVDCTTHDCIRYCYISDSKVEFCAMMYAWEQNGSAHPERQSHLDYEPSDLDVQELKPLIRMREF